MFKGPTGGVVCLMSKGRRASAAASPLAENLLHATPATAPDMPAQTSLCSSDAPTVTGNSPGRSMVLMRVRFVAEWILNMLRELEPAFTAKRCFPATVRAD